MGPRKSSSQFKAASKTIQDANVEGIGISANSNIDKCLDTETMNWNSTKCHLKDKDKCLM